MKKELPAPQFAELTAAQQITVVGGEAGDFASAVGWFVGYAVGCAAEACAFNARVASIYPWL